jgi:outer membrane lipoprotein-sorting protein
MYNTYKIIFLRRKDMKNILLKTVIFLLLMTTPLWVCAEGQQEGEEEDSTVEEFQFTPYSGSDGLSAEQIMEDTNNSLISEDIVADITMTLVNKSGSERIREISIKSKEENDLSKSVMHFISPADVEGTGFLMIELENGDTDMWLYLPELKRIRKIVSSSKNDSFMGSDLTYSDMEERPLSDYTYERYEDETTSNEDCYVIEAVSADDSIINDTGYSKIVYWISKEKLIPVQAFFFDKDGDYFKNMQIADIQKITNTWIPTFITVENVEKEHKTIMELKNIEIDTNPDDSFFTQQYLRRGN